MISVRTLATSSSQALFDQLSRHLMSMDAPCRQANGVIGAYHFGDRRSPAGSLVANDDYLISMEDQSWRSLSEKGIVPTDHAELIDEIEYIHDSFPPEEWEAHLINMAERYCFRHPFCQAA